MGTTAMVAHAACNAASRVSMQKLTRTLVTSCNGQVRKRGPHAQCATITKTNKHALHEAYGGSGVRQMQTGKDSNRGMFFCDDLIAEHATDPWLRPQYPDLETLKHVSE